MSSSWTANEIEITITDYMAMLTLELSCKRFNKSQHNRALQFLLNGRSHGAIERKHQNISSILLEVGMPYITGYKPLSNYQHALKGAVIEYLNNQPGVLKSIADIESTRELHEQVPSDLSRVVTSPPDATELPLARERKTSVASHVDFLEMEVRNSQLGYLGEKYVLHFEKARLNEAGAPKLADKVEWVAQTKGNSAGYDILSFDMNGNNLHSEVKTTNHGKSFPFYISENERVFSSENSESYNLYRVFDFFRVPKLFVLQGIIDNNCTLAPSVYKASFDNKNIAC